MVRRVRKQHDDDTKTSSVQLIHKQRTHSLLYRRYKCQQRFTRLKYYGFIINPATTT